MTKLEEKLIELGYKRTSANKVTNLDINGFHPFYYKYIGKCCLSITINKDMKITNYFIDSSSRFFNNQQDINELQQAFNQLQKDLEVLKEYEEKA